MQPELLFKFSPDLDGENASVRFLMKYVFRPLGSTTSLEEHKGPEDPFLFVLELLWGQAYIERAGVQEYTTVVMFSVEVRRAGELGACSSRQRSGRQRHWKGWYGWGRFVWYSRKREREVSY